MDRALCGVLLLVKMVFRSFKRVMLFVGDFGAGAVFEELEGVSDRTEDVQRE